MLRKPAALGRSTAGVGSRHPSWKFLVSSAQGPPARSAVDEMVSIARSPVDDSGTLAPDQPAVDVVIPTWDRAALLRRALDSVLAQTLPARRIIVVDDGSTDATAALLAEYPQVECLHQENRGVSAARNLGIRHGDSEWVAFLDSDDEWLPEKLAAQFAAWARRPRHRLLHCDEIWIRNGRRVNPARKHRKRGGRIFQYCLPMCVISPSAAVIHRSLLAETGGFNEALPACEDYDLWLRICCRQPVLYVDRPLLRKYGGHADQLSRRHWGMDRFRARALSDLLDSGELSEPDRRAALATLREKCRILVEGARKRGNFAVAEEFAALPSQFEAASAQHPSSAQATPTAKTMETSGIPTLKNPGTPTPKRENRGTPTPKSATTETHGAPTRVARESK